MSSCEMEIRDWRRRLMDVTMNRTSSELREVLVDAERKGYDIHEILSPPIHTSRWRTSKKRRMRNVLLPPPLRKDYPEQECSETIVRLLEPTRENFLLLHTAVAKGDCEMLDVLLGAGMNPDAQDKDGGTALNLALDSLRSPLSMVEALLRAGCDMELSDNTGERPISRACRKQRIAAVSLLLRAGANPRVCGCKGITPLHEVTLGRGNLPILRMLLATDAIADMNSVTCPRGLPVRVDEGKHTLLHVTILRPAIFEYLLSCGADPDVPNDAGYYPIHTVIEEGLTTSLCALISAGAGLDVRDRRGLTPLQTVVHRTNNNALVSIDQERLVVAPLLCGGCSLGAGPVDFRTRLRLFRHGEADW